MQLAEFSDAGVTRDTLLLRMLYEIDGHGIHGVEVCR
jgi:hypothetical protein